MASKYGHPVHLLEKRTGNPIKAIACGKRAGIGGFTMDYRQASCHDCAKAAESLTAQERTEIWDNACERLGKERKNPWADVLKVEAEQKAKAAR